MDNHKSDNKEDLRKLFEQFLGPAEAEQAAKDIREGERIIGEHPGPEPDGELIADIKMKVARAVLRKKATVGRRMAYRVAVAAAVVLLAAIFVSLFEKGDGKSEKIIYASVIPSAIWESEDITADDAELATLTAEIEQIESEISAAQLDETNGNGHDELMELEMELIEINSYFWKG